MRCPLLRPPTSTPLIPHPPASASERSSSCRRRAGAMGNACMKRGGADEDDSLAPLAAEAAAAGARQAVNDAVQKAGAQVHLQIYPEDASDVLVGRVLRLSRAQDAAAAGAKRGLEEMAKNLPPEDQLSFDLKKLKDLASSGARWGLKAAALVRVQGELDQEAAAAAAATGAWIMCCFSLKTGLTPAPNASRYTAVLGPLLGGSLPASAALYALVRASSDLVKLLTFGGLTLGVFVVAFGLIVGHLGNNIPGSVLYTRIATIITFVILLSFFTVVLCKLFSAKPYQFACGGVGNVLIILLVFAWFYFGL